MVDINAEPDLEKCSPSIRRRGIDEERPHPFAHEHRKNIDGKRPSAASWREPDDSIDKARQCCFLCLQSQNGPYAIQVPCRRPEIEDKPKKPGPAENASEGDAIIWNRMLDMYYEMGNWKRWLPFYGPVSVQEVQFEFLRAKDQDGLYEIYDVTPVDIEQVEKWADRTIEKSEACNIDAHFTAEYCDDYMGIHNSGCPKYDDHLEDICGPQECIQDEATEAIKQKDRLKKLYLLKQCARNPHKANGLGTLDGMAQDSCIYNTKDLIVPQRGKPYNPYRENEKTRGIQMVMGWQADRIYLYGPRALSWSALGMAIISVSIVAWGGQSKDWGNAMALGQLLAAFLAVIISSVKE